MFRENYFCRRTS